MRISTHLKLYQLTQKLEMHVQERTLQLITANEELKKEITARKGVEAMLESVFEGIPEPLLLVGRDTSVKLFNRHAAEYFKHIGSQIATGMRLCSQICTLNIDSCIGCELPQAIDSAEPINQERKGLADPERIEQVIAYPVTNDGIATGDSIVRIADLTEERKMAREIAQADKLIALGTVVAGVAHEINNPTHSILLNAPLISDVWQTIQPILNEYQLSNGDFQIGRLLYSQIKQDIPQLISDIESSAKRIERIVKVLKEYSAKNDGFIKSEVDINKVVENTFLLLKYKIKKATRRFHITYGERLPFVIADAQKLEQVFVNLISNALEALSDNTKAVFVETLYNSTKHQVDVKIRDEGVGIAPEIADRIMDPFFTTKRATGGTGLGLSIVQQIVDMHNGMIEIETNPGEGSTFRVVLPESELTGKNRTIPKDDHCSKGVIYESITPFSP